MTTEDVYLQHATRTQKYVAERSRSIQQGSVPTAGNKSTIPYTEIIAWKQTHWKQDVKAFTRFMSSTVFIPIYRYKRNVPANFYFWGV